MEWRWLQWSINHQTGVRGISLVYINQRWYDTCEQVILLTRSHIGTPDVTQAVWHCPFENMKNNLTDRTRSRLHSNLYCLLKQFNAPKNPSIVTFSWRQKVWNASRPLDDVQSYCSRPTVDRVLSFVPPRGHKNCYQFPTRSKQSPWENPWCCQCVTTSG